MTEIKSIKMYVTDSNYCKTLTESADITAGCETTDVSANITINPQIKFQTIDGIGASFTDSSAYLINQVLSRDVRDNLMKELFDPEVGIGISILRNTMGSSDFARETRSYCDSDVQDTALENFKLDIDKDDIIPLIQDAIKLNPQLKAMASPWSPPAWMKSDKNMVGGELLPEYYEAYARYFVKYIKGYQAKGINICAVTPQNEALYSPEDYAGMLFPAEHEAVFIRDYLKPNFIKEGIHAKIFCYDHNWDCPEYPQTVFELAGDSVDGVAWHYYGGDVEMQTTLHDRFPDKEVHFTEASGGEWVNEGFVDGIVDGINIFNNYSQTYIRWNIALDEDNGPTVPTFVRRSTCHGIYKISQKDGSVERMEDFYIIAHFSKFVKPGAKRILSQCNADAVKVAAFENIDGSIAIVIANTACTAQKIGISVNDDCFQTSLDAKSVCTIVVPKQ